MKWSVTQSKAAINTQPSIKQSNQQDKKAYSFSYYAKKGLERKEGEFVMKILRELITQRINYISNYLCNCIDNRSKQIISSRYDLGTGLYLILRF